MRPACSRLPQPAVVMEVGRCWRTRLSGLISNISGLFTSPKKCFELTESLRVLFVGGRPFDTYIRSRSMYLWLEYRTRWYAKTRD